MKGVFYCFLLAFIIPVAGWGQQKDFEGEITYRQVVHSKLDNVSDEQMQSYFGDGVTVIIKHGNYRQHYLHADGVTDVIYISSLNRWFYKMKDIDTLFFRDCSTDTSRVISLHKDTVTATILGFACKTLRLETSNFTLQYFYADSLYINPDNFTQHVFLHYNLYAMESKAVYLRLLGEGNLFTSELMATNLVGREISDNEFDLPKLPQVER